MANIVAEGQSAIFRLIGKAGFDYPLPTIEYGTASSQDFDYKIISTSSDGRIIEFKITAIQDNFEETDLEDFSISMTGQKWELIHTNLGHYYEITKDTSEISISIKDKGPSVHCLVDLDGDGRSTWEEIEISEARNKIDQLIQVEQNYRDHISSLHERYSALQEESHTLTTEMRLSTAKYIASLWTGGLANSAYALAPALTEIAANTARAIINGEPISTTLKDNYLKILEIVDSIAKSPGKIVPVFNYATNSLNFVSDSVRFGQAMKVVDANLKVTLEQIDQTSRAAQAAQKAYRDLDKCITKSENADRDIVSMLSEGTSYAALKAFVGDPEQAAIAPDATAFQRVDGMPAGMFIALGSDSRDVIFTESSSSAPDRLFLAELGRGDDQINVGLGTTYVMDTGGSDLAVLRDASGKVASVADIGINQLVDEGRKLVILSVGDNTYLTAEGIERFAFREGTFEISGGELKFSAAPEGLSDLIGKSFAAIARQPLDAPSIAKIQYQIENGEIAYEQVADEVFALASRSTIPVLLMTDLVQGKTPDAQRLDTLTAFAKVQWEYYRSIGVANPDIGPYEALGLGLAHTENFAARYGALVDTAFVQKAYLDAFGRAAPTASVQHFQKQLDHFEAMYLGAGVKAQDAQVNARGAVLGQMVGIAVDENEAPQSNMAETYLLGFVTGASTVGVSLYDWF